MQTDIHYRDITRTDYLEAYLLEKIEGQILKFMNDDPSAHLTVRVETERHRTQNRKPIFTCEVILKPTHSKKVLKVRKTHDDFYTCVSDICEAMKKILRRRASRRASAQKRFSSFHPDLTKLETEGFDELGFKIPS